MPAAPIQGCPPLRTQTARGRQAYCIESPDHLLKAFYRARNLWVSNIDGSAERQVTQDGSEQALLKSALEAGCMARTGPDHRDLGAADAKKSLSTG
jgi:hypothetical protein